MLLKMASCNGASAKVNSFKILIISFSSSTLMFCISLFISKVVIGSIYSVEPLEEMSCTKPFISFLYSSFTGTTYLPSLIVIIESIINFDFECTKSCNLSFNLCSKILLFFLKFKRVGDALSAIVFSSIIFFFP